MLIDAIVGVALVLTLGFGYAAYIGSDELAAWLAGGLAVAGLLRLCTIVTDVYWPDH